MATVFGTRVREERQRRGLSQVALATQAREQDVGPDASAVKLDDTAIARIERGARNITLQQAVAIARSLDVAVSSLLEPSEAMGAAAELRRVEREAEDLRAAANAATARAEVADARVARLRRIVESGADIDSDAPASSAVPSDTYGSEQ